MMGLRTVLGNKSAALRYWFGIWESSYDMDGRRTAQRGVAPV